MMRVVKCNFSFMEKWSQCYGNDGSLGTMLFDTFGDKVFFDNITGRLAKIFDLRCDSGDELEQVKNIVKMYNRFGIDPRTKKVIFSNALNGKKAIELHKEINGCVLDGYGIGTWLTCSFDPSENVSPLPIKPMNIVIKVTDFRYTPKRDWIPCVKLSCDPSKAIGDPRKIEYLKYELGIK